MARIAIDARKIRDFGIGTYVHNLLTDLERVPNPHQFIVFLPPREALPVASPRFRKVAVRTAHYGLAEHVTLPLLAHGHRVHLYHAPHYVLPLLAPRRSVVTIHDLIHLRFPEYLPSRLAFHYARQVIRRSYRRAARVLTVSEWTKQDLLEWFGGSPERIVVVPNRVDEVFFRARGAEELDRVRERWRLPHRFILYAGNIKPHKNLERLVRAFARVRAEPDGQDVKLVLLGNDLARYHVLRRLAAELRVVEHVRLLGWLPQEELVAVYRLATVFAYPSLYEGFGLPPLEAMACATPVVAARAASLPEVLGDAAHYVDPLDVDSVAQGLLAVLGDDVQRKDLVRRGRSWAEGFRRGGQAEAILRVYDEALA